MNIKSIQARRRGFTLLLTLLTLVLLAGLIVRFQADTTLHVRASNYRVYQLQCRYAAESAVVAARQIIRATQRQMEEAQRNARIERARKRAAPKSESELLKLVDPCSLSDPCSLLDPCSTADPCSIGDPCGLADLIWAEEEIAEEISPFLFARQKLKIGLVSVEIKIYDENSKFPIYWLLHSPIEKNTDYRDKSVKLLAERLEAEPAANNEAVDLARKTGKAMNVPEPMNYLYRRSSGRSRYRRVAWRLKRSRQSKSLAGKGIDHNKLLRQTMSNFFYQWQEELKQNEKYKNMLTPLPNHPARFADYIGCWGHNRININTAPVEVLEAAFLPLGITKKTAEAVVVHREKNPFANPTQLQRVRGISRTMLNAAKVLSTTSSDTFSIQITTSLGRASYSLYGSIYKSRRNKLVNQAVFPGEAAFR
ncbi:MAG: general secretion pathway protein GspK [Sedimentisphaerales bacterium]|nr:general secretion pathway protein GspK [Sedimentisphaerales bacterium]